MRSRKLFYAKDCNGELVYIDKLKTEDKDKDYFCPKCSSKVLAKQGDKKIWHFSHIDKECFDNDEKKQNTHFTLENFPQKVIQQV